jgi:hypothetical protein
MKLYIPAHWFAGRWWENRILWLLWLFAAALFCRDWLEERGSAWPPLIGFVASCIVLSVGFIMADVAERRRNRQTGYRLPGED